MRNLLFTLIASFVFVTGAGTSLSAAPYHDTWIFRSPVTPDQSMWGPGTQTGYYDKDTWEYRAGIFKAGFEWSLQADLGTVFGNVEGNITAEYNKFVAQPGKTTINLSYKGIDKESQIGTSFGVEAYGRPYIGVDLPWPIPNINLGFPLKFLQADLDTKTDFTTGLDETVFASGRHDLIPFSADVVFASVDCIYFLHNDISFVPNTITGIMKYIHLATGTTREKTVTFPMDTGDDPDDPLKLEADLDLPGAWEFSLEDFRLSENTFTMSLNFGVEVSVGVPIIGLDVGVEADFMSFADREFPLDFLNHGYDGDVETVDRLGRFCLLVVPEPATLGLLLLGGLALLRRRR